MRNASRKVMTIASVASSVSLFMATSCTPTSEQRVDELYNAMSPEERVAQLQSIYISKLFTPDGIIDDAKCHELIPNGIGHISQFAMDLGLGPEEQRDYVAQLQKWLIDNTPHHIPALVHEEALSGVNAKDATVYPQQIGLACSFNTSLAEQKTRQTASALRNIGGLLALSPMVDVVRNPSFNRLEESYGEDAYLSAAFGVAFVKGLQHNGDLHQGVAACTKHFLGYGGGGNAPKGELLEEILLPHEAIIRTAGSQVVMTGYHDIDGTKCVANSWLQHDILRNYVGFDGLTVSDYGSIPQISETISQAELCAAAINGGNEVDFPHGATYAHIPEALKLGLITEQSVEKAVKHVLMLKLRLGMLDENPQLYAQGPIKFDTDEERATAYQLATQSVVMLKNDTLTIPNQDKSETILPLLAEKLQTLGGRIFLTGPNANSMWAMAGDYSFQAMRYFWRKSDEGAENPHYVFLKEGMEHRLPQGATLTYARGCDWTEVPETVMEKGGDPRVAEQNKINNRMVDNHETANWNEALKMAAQSDVIVAAMGENVLLSGENRNRTKLSLPGRQEEYVEALLATGKPVVLIVFGGRAQIITELSKKCAAIIQAWYPGEEGGNALADIIFGSVSPSGKLSVSYPAVELNEPICYNNGLESDTRIAWPFGFGLSYAHFDYSNLVVDNQVATNAEAFSVSLDVANTSSVDADEVVQIYVSPTDTTSLLKPIQLQGFARLSLKAGEKQTVRFRLFTEQLGYYDNGEWNIAPGRFIIKAAASSQDIRCQQEVELTGPKYTKKLRDHYICEQSR